MYSVEKHKEFFRKAAKDNEGAYEFLCTMGRVFRVWDDLYDKDREVKKEEADEVFKQLNFELSRNSFYRRNQDALAAFIFVAWNAWKDSEAWKGSDKKVQGICAWFLRDMCNELVPLVAWIVGGCDHAREISLEYRAFLLDRLIANGMDGFVR